MIRASIVGFRINPPSSFEDLPQPPSVSQEIVGLLKDPQVPLAKLIRLITIEMTYLNIGIRSCIDHGAPLSRIKSYMRQINALRAISKTLVESNARARRDVLNMDGPQFHFVIGEIVKCFKEALKDATRNTPENEFLFQTTMRIFSDLFAQREQEIRRKAAEIES